MDHHRISSRQERRCCTDSSLPCCRPEAARCEAALAASGRWSLPDPAEGPGPQCGSVAAASENCLDAPTVIRTATPRRAVARAARHASEQLARAARHTSEQLARAARHASEELARAARHASNQLARAARHASEQLARAARHLRTASSRRPTSQSS